MAVKITASKALEAPLTTLLEAPSGLPARRKRATLHVLSLLLDCLALASGYLVASNLREQQWLEIAGQPLPLLAIPIFVMFEIARETQSVEALESRSIGTTRALSSLGATALFIVCLSFLFKVEGLSRVGFAVSFGTAAILIVIGKVILDRIFWSTMQGTATASLLLIDGLKATPEKAMKVIDLQAVGMSPNLANPGAIDILSRIIEPYDRVVVACPYERRAAWATFLRGHDVGGEILLDGDLTHGAVAIGQSGSDDTLILSRGPLNLAQRMQKVLLLPLFALVAAALKLESSDPVFFRQTRIGLGNRLFTILKFRSMRQDLADGDGRRSTSRQDERVTRVGKFIRRTSIDELPQLLNVWRGDMSIVGPRPHALGSLAGDNLFWEITDGYWVRHALKPGITGLAQVRGFRGATAEPADLKNRVRADLEYLTNWSLWLDFVIVLRTLRVLMHDNAY
jgi:lipopolysaccharide/colanic/teichoic acid biosynthesis glycosyltransferase